MPSQCGAAAECRTRQKIILFVSNKALDYLDMMNFFELNIFESRFISFQPEALLQKFIDYIKVSFIFTNLNRQ